MATAHGCVIRARVCTPAISPTEHHSPVAASSLPRAWLSHPMPGVTMVTGASAAMLQYLAPAGGVECQLTCQPGRQVCRPHCPAAAVTDSGDATRVGDRHASIVPEEWGVTCDKPLPMNIPGCREVCSKKWECAIFGLALWEVQMSLRPGMGLQVRLSEGKPAGRQG